MILIKFLQIEGLKIQIKRVKCQRAIFRNSYKTNVKLTADCVFKQQE